MAYKLIITESQASVLTEYLLTENRMQWLRDNFSDINPEVFQRLERVDPTPNHSYLQWLLTLYRKGAIDMQKRLKLHNLLLNFHHVKDRLPEQKRNILQYRTIEELEEMISVNTQDPEVTKSKRQRAKEDKEKGARTLYEDGRYRVLEILSKEGAIYYGKGTKWCTSESEKDNRHFEYYTDYGWKLYILFDKDTGRKIQFQFERYEIKNEANEDIPFLHFLQYLSDIRLLKLFRKNILAIESFSLKKTGDRIIPEVIKELTNLQYLTLEDLPLEEFPVAIYSIKKLEYVAIENCGIKSIPEGIGALENLDQLLLMHNSLESLPADLGNLKNLDILNLNNNNFKKLDAASLPGSLSKLYMKDNPMPKEQAEKLSNNMPDMEVYL